MRSLETPINRGQGEAEALTAARFERLRRFVYRTSGIELDESKRCLVESRIGSHMRALGIREMEEYLRAVERGKDDEIRRGLIDHLTTNHTGFLREGDHFALFRRWLGQGVAEGGGRLRRPLRIWSAACSSGEEPYTLAMAACAELGMEAAGEGVAILASDLSWRMLTKAMQAVYGEDQVAVLPESWREQYLQRGTNRWAGYWRVRAELRAMVRFTQINLIEPLPNMKEPDMIFCRNVMIYFDAVTRRRVVSGLVDQLGEGGVLVVGHSDSLGGSEPRLEYLQPAVYQKKAGA